MADEPRRLCTGSVSCRASNSSLRMRIAFPLTGLRRAPGFFGGDALRLYVLRVACSLDTVDRKQ